MTLSLAEAEQVELGSMPRALLAMVARELMLTGAPPLLTEEAARIMTAGVPTDDATTLAELGCTLRPPVETFADTVAHLRAIGLAPPAAA